MKIAAAALFAAAALLSANAAFAGADDTKWIAQCIKDNASEKATVETVTKYCACMNEKMDENETKSITEWEKTHPAEQKACDAVAGWR